MSASAAEKRVIAAEKRAVASQALRERANELETLAYRISNEGQPSAAAGIKVAVEHLRGYVTYRLPFDFQD